MCVVHPRGSSGGAADGAGVDSNPVVATEGFEGFRVSATVADAAVSLGVTPPLPVATTRLRREAARAASFAETDPSFASSSPALRRNFDADGMNSVGDEAAVDDRVGCAADDDSTEIVGGGDVVVDSDAGGAVAGSAS